jgi:hypothetical protein
MWREQEWTVPCDSAQCATLSTLLAVITLSVAMSLLCGVLWFFTTTARNNSGREATTIMMMTTIVMMLPLVGGFLLVINVHSLRARVVYTFFTRRALSLWIYWIVILSVSLVLLTRYAPHAKSTTRLRKWFHLLVVVLFVPALYVSPDLLVLAGTLVLALMCFVEYARHVNMFGVGVHITVWLQPFIAHVEVRPIIYSHMTLLLGCILPLFVLDLPSSPTPASLLLAASGILCLGVGDAMVSPLFSFFIFVGFVLKVLCLMCVCLVCV